jgi:hypothetical protein
MNAWKNQLPRAKTQRDRKKELLYLLSGSLRLCALARWFFLVDEFLRSSMLWVNKNTL